MATASSLPGLIRQFRESTPGTRDHQDAERALGEALASLPPGVVVGYGPSNERYVYAMKDGRIDCRREVPAEAILLAGVPYSAIRDGLRDATRAIFGDQIRGRTTGERLERLVRKCEAVVGCRCDSATPCPPCADDLEALALAAATDPREFSFLAADDVPDAAWGEAMLADAIDETFPGRRRA